MWAGVLHAQLPSNIFYRTFKLNFPKGGGTAFFIDHLGKHFVITAAHVVPGIGDGNAIDLVDPESLAETKIEIEKVIRCGENDIVALLPKSQDFDWMLKFPLKFGAGGDWFLGEFAFFAGFPLGTRLQLEMPGGKRLMPFLKRASLAMQVKLDGREYLFLDGVNTPGFSGGPIYKLVGSGAETKVHLLGVISGYQQEKVPVKLAGQPTQFWVAINSGIVVAHPIHVAIDAIEAHLKK